MPVSSGDDLAAVWGPEGRATTDPSSIRTVAPAPQVGATAARTPTPPPVWTARPSSRRGPTKVGAAAVGVLALGAIVVGLAVFGNGRSSPSSSSSPDDDVRSEAATATTIVSAAADLLHLAVDTPDGDETPTTTTSVAATKPAATDDELRAVDGAAAAFTAAMNAPDCDALWNLLSSRTRQFFEAAVAGQAQSPSSLLCEALREGAPVTTVEGAARRVGTDRALVPIAADGDVEDITFVLEEDGRWRVDLLALQEATTTPRRRAATNSEAVQATLRDASTAEAVAFTDDDRFTDDLTRLADLEPAVRWRAGIAPVSAEVGDVYVVLGDERGSVVCLSAKADNGARFLVKRTRDGGVTYRGGEIPATCDSSPLDTSW
jgi:hypothetical protein